MKIYYYCLQITLLFSCNSIFFAKNIIFDFGEVLIFTDKRFSFKELGILNIIQYSLQSGINPFSLNKQLRKKLYFILDETGKRNGIKDHYTYYPVHDENGIELPFLMNVWLRGDIQSSQIRFLIQEEIDTHPEWFLCAAERKMLHNLIAMIFTPSLFVQSRRISADGIKFIQRCKKEGHKVYGLSNWDPESYTVLKEKHSDFFNLFDGVVISGVIHSNKPNQIIYQALINQYNLIPDQCWFIDDQKENIESARKLGINAVIYEKSFAHVAKNIKLLQLQSLEERKALMPTGIKSTAAKHTAAMIIEGENTSRIDSIDDNLLPAKV